MTAVNPAEIPAVVRAAMRMRERVVQTALPLTTEIADDAMRALGATGDGLGQLGLFGDRAAGVAVGTTASSTATRFDSATDEMVQLALDLPKSQRPKIVIVGTARTPPKTTQSLVKDLVGRGMVPGEDVIVTRYADLAVGKQRGYVRLKGTQENLAGQGAEALFLFRGGGNLKERHLAKISWIQAVDGASAITDLSFIERAGSKSTTFEILSKLGFPLPITVPVATPDEAVRALTDIGAKTGGTTAVLKKVNSLGGKDVHFVSSEQQIRSIMTNPQERFVMQEVIANAKDQDVRVHLVWNRVEGKYVVQNAYVRNRTPFENTPNLANGGTPTKYVLSPWEQEVAEKATAALAEGSASPPLHVALDFFPREKITATTSERNAEFWRMIESGSMSREEALTASADTMVIGEAASSAGTKGTELVLGEGNNPVTGAMADEMVRMRTELQDASAVPRGAVFPSYGAPAALADATEGTSLAATVRGSDAVASFGIGAAAGAAGVGAGLAYERAAA